MFYTKTQRGILAGICAALAFWSLLVLMVRHGWDHDNNTKAWLYKESYWRIYGQMSVWLLVILGCIALFFGCIIFFTWWIGEGADKSKKKAIQETVRNLSK